MKNNFSGFSLIEILVCMMIMLFIAVGIYGVSNVGERTYSTDMGLLELQQQARQSIGGMVRELRQSDSSDITITNGGEKIEFRIPRNISVSNITYYPDIGYEKTGTQIIRSYNGTNSILANDINSLDFCCENEDVLEIQLSAQKSVNRKTVSFPLNGTISEKVRLRN
jgi:prepilin-type N-terminal cleavage/methylation domain-containing protein